MWICKVCCGVGFTVEPNVEAQKGPDKTTPPNPKLQTLNCVSYIFVWRRARYSVLGSGCTGSEGRMRTLVSKFPKVLP